MSEKKYGDLVSPKAASTMQSGKNGCHEVANNAYPILCYSISSKEYSEIELPHGSRENSKKSDISQHSQPALVHGADSSPPPAISERRHTLRAVETLVRCENLPHVEDSTASQATGLKPFR